jgi:poly(hydroxyalkanoate) granule-associated protein
MPKKAPATKPSAAMRRRKPVTPAERSGAGWPVGLGALAKAQQEGAKVFENLRRQGQRLEQKTREAAADTAAKAREMQQIAGGTLDKLEQVFEERVERALSKLGIYTQNDIQKLAERVDELSEAVNKLLHAQGIAPAPRKAKRPVKSAVKARAKPAAEPAAKTAAKRAAKRAA